MKRKGMAALGLCGILLGSTAQIQPADPLTRARRAYNERQFDEAISAAKLAIDVPASSNVAAVVLARAYLERFRAGAGSDVADIEAARAALARVRPDLLAPPDRVEFLVGQGVAMFVDGCGGGCYSVAAEFFELALAGSAAIDPASREPIFEWWATALDHQAQYGLDTERIPIYQRLLGRAEAERARDQNSASAAYWVAAAARGTGDFHRAWGAAVAGWIQARHFGARGEQLRTDLNRLVVDILLPERAIALAPDADPRPVLEQLRKQWAELTEKYK